MQQASAIAQGIASRFVDARKACAPLADYPGAVPDSLDSAYAIQDAAIPMFGDAIPAWKVGRLNPPWVDTLGTDRLAGPVFARSIAAADGCHPVGYIFNGGFGAVEAEFVFRIGSAVPSGDAPLSLEQAADLVDAVFVGFEIASSPFSGINALGPLVTISDFGNNNGLLIGPEIPDWRTSGLETWTVETLANGNRLGAGQASAFTDGPLGSVRFLLENLIARGIRIAPGLLISTGAVTGVHQVSAGDRIEARFGDFATIACAIANAVRQDRETGA